jgi:hypothetical protein
MQEPILLKLDVQGFELEVLRGAEETMKRAEVILLELSLVRYNRTAPLFDEIVKFMKEHSFLAYDFCDFHRFDDVVLQLDAFFVKENSPLRKLDFCC